MPPRKGVIALRVQSIDRLFDAADPSPFGQQDLGEWASEYIVESLKEMEPEVAEHLEILVAGSVDPFADTDIGSAIATYFLRQSGLRRRALRRLLRHGMITLAIGAIFLAAFFGISQLIVRLLGDAPVASLLREGMLIVGWVAMWRPIEIFLFDWWPIIGERRLYDRLARLDVRIIRERPASSPSESRGVRAGGEGLGAARAIERWENEGGRINGLVETAHPWH